jgi:hypothetical protein
MTLRYEYSCHNTSSPSFIGSNGSLFFFKAQTIIGVVAE